MRLYTPSSTIFDKIKKTFDVKFQKLWSVHFFKENFDFIPGF